MGKGIKKIRISIQIYHRNSCSSELYVFVLIVGYPGNTGQVLSYQGAEDTVSCSMKNAYTADAQQDSVVDEVGHGLDGFVSAHTPHVDVVLEVELLFIHVVLCLGADKAACGITLLDRCIGMLQAVNLDVCLDHTKGHDGGLSADIEYFAHARLPLYLHNASLSDGLCLSFDDRV